MLCAYVFATVRLTRLSRLRCREANTLGVRSAYSLAAACRAAVETCRQYRYLGTRSTTESGEIMRLRIPPDGPKSRKLHLGEFVGRKYVSPHSPV